MATRTSPNFTLMYDMRAPAFGAPATALYAAALEQCAWADRLGFAEVVLNEHHNTGDGYLPSPRVMAGAIASRTERLRIHLSALVVTLHDPLHVAEDLAVLDVISNGRIDVTLGAGYRREEFLMFGTNWKRRPSLMREAVRLMRAAWSGEPFEHNGTTVRVLPRPVQGTIPLWLAGSSEGAARRAAQLDIPFEPVGDRWWVPYEDEMQALGKPVPPRPAPATPATFLHVTNDPEADWARIAPHALHHTNEYASYAKRKDLTPFPETTDPSVLLAGGDYRVVTPDQCVELCGSLGPGGNLRFSPLLGGLDPDLAWESLQLFEHQVLPRLA